MLKLCVKVSSSGLEENSKICGIDLILKQTKMCTMEPEVRSSLKKAVFGKTSHYHEDLLRGD